MNSFSSDLQVDASDQGGRRTRLREFQAQLVERMQTARDSDAMQANRLGVIIGGTRWLLDLQSAGEIVSAEGITSVPLTQPWYLGLINLRGNLLGIVDLARFQGGERTVLDKDSRIVALSPALGFNCGLLVSRVLGLRHVDEMRVHQADETLIWASTQYVDHEAHVWHELDLHKLVQQPEFLNISR
ncbi:chemotaxis protein CheW [uncultured Oxalicibacterium sp.]|uniref:chemotaxis protein CheW n=1 Tax=uncultured Oxalicibacterium sp. TaxID=1168540 RepID=UPI0025CC8E37|nr:chemotaxis protein CheW [uncultured Oxalicibacterium sp.]